MRERTAQPVIDSELKLTFPEFPSTGRGQGVKIKGFSSTHIHTHTHFFPSTTTRVFRLMDFVIGFGQVGSVRRVSSNIRRVYERRFPRESSLFICIYTFFFFVDNARLFPGKFSTKVSLGLRRVLIESKIRRVPTISSGS